MDAPPDDRGAPAFVRRFDDLQADHAWLAAPIGVLRKYADDRGSALAGLLTFQVFLGILPLFVVGISVFGSFFGHSTQLQQAVPRSAAEQVPAIGEQIRAQVRGVHIAGPWVALSVAGLLWTATGIYTSFQLDLNQVWNVPGVDRQGFWSRLWRAAVLFASVFAAAIGATLLRRLFPGVRPDGVVWVATFLGSALLAAGLLLGAFRLAAAPTVPTRLLVPAALLAGLAWEVLQRVGTWLVADRLSRAQALYGSIGIVVVTLSWINLLARSVIVANEAVVVVHRRLWPRRIAQPPLTDADRRVLRGLVRNERRRPEEHVEVTFDDRDDDGRSGEGIGRG
jgi:YihY family inner membrane protein